MVFSVYRGFENSPVYVHLMQLMAWVMTAIFFYMLLRPYKQFKDAIGAEDWAAAGAALNRVRIFVLSNLILGIILLVVVTAGRYM